MFKPILSTAAMVLLFAGAATGQAPEPLDPNYLSLCLDAKKAVVGTAEVVRGINGARKRACPAGATQVRLATDHIIPHQSDIKAGVVPTLAPSSLRSYDFRFLMDGVPPQPDPPLKTVVELSNGLAVQVGCRISPDAGFVGMWQLQTLDGLFAVIDLGLGPQQIGGDTEVLGQGIDIFDLAGQEFSSVPVPNFGQPDFRESPGLVIVGIDGTEIRVSNARSHLGTDVADCIHVGTVTVVGRSVRPRSLDF